MRILCLIGFLGIAAQAQTWNFRCPGGETFDVTVSQKQATLRMPGKAPLRLRQVPAASGAKYSDGYTVFWNQGNEGMIQSGEVNVNGCTAASPSEASRPMSGMFIYMADAAMFTDCASGRRYPVAMEGAYLELERAYTQNRPSPGEPLFVKIEGKIQNKPKMEGPGTVPTLIVTKFISVDTQGHCSEPPGELLGRWRLTSLGKSEVKLERPPNLEFLPETSRVAGFGGCNRLMGSYKRKGNELELGPLASTMMACMGEAMTIEKRFSEALSGSRSYRIQGQELQLIGRNGEILARLVKETGEGPK